MNKKIVVMALGAGLLCFSGYSKNAAQAIALDSLDGNQWNHRNSTKEKVCDYQIGNYRLRLENVNVHETSGDNNTGFWGTLTVTDRRHLKADPHCFVDFKIVNGRVQYLKLRTDGGKNWFDALPGVRVIFDTIDKMGTSGNAQKAMATSVSAVIEGYKAASSK